MACLPLSRWVHRNRRSGDVEVMWPSLLARASSVEEARVAWDVFISQQGQEHWHCDCGQPIAELFRVVTVSVEA
jgi:hypothetical protein